MFLPFAFYFGGGITDPAIGQQSNNDADYDGKQQATFSMIHVACQLVPALVRHRLEFGETMRHQVVLRQLFGHLPQPSCHRFVLHVMIAGNGYSVAILEIPAAGRAE